jgi:predicted permease
VFVARVTSAALLGFLPPQHAPALAALRFAATPGILGFVAALCCASCMIFGLAPALRLGRGTDASRLRVGASTGHQASRWMSRTLVVAQVAMCTLLLMLAGVFLRTLGNLRGQDTGYREGRLMVADVWAPREDAEDRRDQLIEDLRGRIALLPGVEVASFSNAGQLSGSGIEFRIGFPDRPWHAEDAPLVFEQRITPGFLSAMGTILIAGRDFTTADDARGRPVAVVNRAFASRFFPGVDPVGRRFFRSDGRQTRDEMEIVGVVQSSKWVNLRDESPAMYYRPYAQMGGSPRVRFAIRANGDLEALAAAIKSTAPSVDRDMTVENVVPFSVIVDRTLVVERLVAQVSSAFGLLALATAGVGLYGLLAYGVARRRREIGVRMALGATAGAVEWMILGESLALFGCGCAIGVPLALVANRQASSMLYGLTPGDPLTVVLALVTLGVVTAAASYVPARRAATIDPMLALRDE